MGAHPKRTREIELDVLAAMSRGETLTSACDRNGITTSAWRTWCRADKDLDIAHGEARDEGYDRIAADCLEIADETGNDTKYGKDGQESADSEWISRSKLRVETRLKLLAKWDPRRYGDKVALTGGNATDAPIKTESSINVAGLTDEQLRVLASIKVGT